MREKNVPNMQASSQFCRTLCQWAEHSLPCRDINDDVNNNNDNNNNDNNNNEILIKREPLVYTRAPRCTEKKAMTVQQQ